MTATQYDIVVEQNADWTHTFAVTSDGTTPVDLTGARGRMQIRNFYQMQGGIVLAEASSQNGGITIDGPQGLVHVRLGGAQTALIDQGVIGKYDLLIYKPDGTTTRIVQGSVSVSRGVTMGQWASQNW